MDRIPVLPRKKDTLQKTKPATTLPPLRTTQQSNTGSQISGKSVAIRGESPVALPPLIQSKSGEILGSQPLFTSEHDDKVGSVYFKMGRLRLIHSHGPAREVYESYCICLTNPDEKARNRELQTMIIWLKQYLDYGYFVTIDHFKKRFSKLISMIEVDKHSVTASMQGNLFELILNSSGCIKGYHPSRGHVSPLKKTLTQEQLDFLELSVVYSEKISQWIIQGIDINGHINRKVDTPKELLRKTLKSPGFEQARANMIWKIFSPLIGIYFQQDNIDKAISDIMEELKIFIKISEFSDDLRRYLFDRKYKSIETKVVPNIFEKKLINKYRSFHIYYLHSVHDFIKQPLQDPATLAYYTILRINIENNKEFMKRLRGYFGNQLLRSSGALDNTGLDVDDDN